MLVVSLIALNLFVMDIVFPLDTVTGLTKSRPHDRTVWKTTARDDAHTSIVLFKTHFPLLYFLLYLIDFYMIYFHCNKLKTYLMNDGKSLLTSLPILSLKLALCLMQGPHSPGKLMEFYVRSGIFGMVS